MTVETVRLTIAFASAFACGVFFGFFFFGGLRWTVQKGMSSTAPARWFLGSIIVRTSVVLVGFYFVGSGHWELLVAALLGFVVARQQVVSRADLKGNLKPVAEIH